MKDWKISPLGRRVGVREGQRVAVFSYKFVLLFAFFSSKKKKPPTKLRTYANVSFN